MSSSYLPSTDSGMNSWGANFASRIGAAGAAATFGLTEKQATDYAALQADYAALQADYAAKLTAATEPETRGGATILAKNTAKKALVASSRKLAMQVTNFEGVTDQQRYDLGLTVRDREPSPVPVPGTSPTIDIQSVDGWTVNFRLHNGDSTKRAKPAGVSGASVFSYVGEAPPVEVDAWKFEGSITVTESRVIFPSTLPPGTKVWMTAFWFNTKAESGPAATPISRLINYGNMSQAA